jgi:hypothetical protein
MPNLVQQTIQKTRVKMHELNRQFAHFIKRSKDEDEARNTSLEMLLDEVCAETGLRVENEKDHPAIVMHGRQVMAAIKRRKEEAVDVDPDAIMKDFIF